MDHMHLHMQAVITIENIPAGQRKGKPEIQTIEVKERKPVFGRSFQFLVFLSVPNMTIFFLTNSECQKSMTVLQNCYLGACNYSEQACLPGPCILG